MTTQNKIIIVVVLMVASFAGGRYLTPEKVVTKTVTVEVEKSKENIKDNTIIVEEIKPDGTKKITTKKDIQTIIVNKRENNTKENTETTNKSSSTILSVMGGVNVLNPTGMIFGGHVSRQLLGPLHIGIFGLTSGTFGASVGIEL